MKRLASLAAVLCFVGASFAHEPADTEYLVYQFADGNTPDADGDLSDWDIVPDSYTIGNDKIYGTIDQGAGTGVGLSDPSDLNMTHRVGWNENANRLYVVTTVFDNLHDRTGEGCFCTDASYDLEVNMDHSAHADENPEDFVNRIAYKYAVPPVDGAYAFSRPVAAVADAWLFPGSEWLDFGWSFTGEEFGESTYTYEQSIVPIESFAWDGSEGSAVVWDLEEGDLFHLAIGVGDVDVPSDAYHVFWSTSPTAWTTDFVLDEMIDTLTAVENDSWARIKAQYK